jgi:phenylalanyl-tRNA synthetase beta chain
MKVSRAWLQTYFEDELPSADELAETFTFHAFEVEGVEQVDDDWVIDVDVLPNRSSDALSHRGVARDLATLLSRPLKKDPLREPLPAWEEAPNLEIAVADAALCPRYMGAVMRGVTVRPSPDWLKEALETLGQRSINNIVDATNYVMLNTGQPLHAFDLSKLEHDDDGMRRIGVRLARDGEEIRTLTGDDYTLKATHQVITDANADEPIAIAGVKGGARAEITTDTVDLVLEAANFHYVNVRMTSQDLKLSTDASQRFQNDPSVRLPAFAMRDLIELISELSGGTLAGVTDVYDRDIEYAPIDVTQTEINNMLGTDLSIDDIERILVRLEWEFSLDGEEFAVTGPWERTDINIKEDVIEEIGRIYGYRDLVGILPPHAEKPAAINKNQYYTDAIRQALVSAGYSEVLTYTLTDSGVVELQNPFASDKSFMRQSLTEGMQGALELNTKNAPLLGLSAVKIFEIGTIFAKKGEQLSLCVGNRALTGKQSKADEALLDDVRKALTKIGVKGEVKVEDGITEVVLDNHIDLLPTPEKYGKPLPWNQEARYTRWSPYPFVLRDIAVWVPKDIAADTVLCTIREQASNLLVRADQFDTYEKDDRVSYAWHLVFQSYEQTLTDLDVNEVMKKVTKALEKTKDWEVR